MQPQRQGRGRPRKQQVVNVNKESDATGDLHLYPMAQSPGQGPLPPTQPQRRGRGHPRKERKAKQKSQPCSPNPHPSHSHPLGDVAHPPDGVEVVGVDTARVTRNCTKWDPHAGMKPSRWDDCASDGELELEDDLPYGGAIVNRRMTDMMANLGDNDEWLPWNEPMNLELINLDDKQTSKVIRRSQAI